MSQILGFIAKGSFGPILKVKDKAEEKTYAVKVNTSRWISTDTSTHIQHPSSLFSYRVSVKVLPKSEILRHGVLEQSKEEVIIQVGNTVTQTGQHTLK